MPIVKPACFGKTYLVVKLLRQVADEGQRFIFHDCRRQLTLTDGAPPSPLERLVEKTGQLLGRGASFLQTYLAASSMPERVK